jgi:hypothetical protein
MSVEHPDTPEHPDGRITWSVYLATLAAFCLVGGGATLLLGPLAFGVALFLGAVTGFVVNLVRPRYDGAVGSWRTIYDFLLKQMPPPD